MAYYLMLVLSAVGIAGNFALTKLYQKTMGNGIREGVFFNMCVGLFGMILFWIAGGFVIEMTPYSLWMTFLQALFVGGYTVIGFQIMSLGSMTVYTLFLMLGGALVPYLFGLFFLEETVNASKLIAMILVVVAVILTGFSKEREKQTIKFLLLCGLVFLLNGASSIVGKLHQIEKVYPVVSEKMFVLLNNGIRFLIFAFFLPFFSKRKEKSLRQNGKMAWVMLLSAGISGEAYVLQLIGAAALPATLLYPVITGGTIVGSSLLDRLCFGERIHRNIKISIGICMIALILFAM